MRSRRVATAACVAVAALALLGCNGGGTGGERSDAAPTACSSSGARDVVADFLARDSRDPDQILATFIASEPQFQWFSTRERIGMEVAADRSTLARYLDERRQRAVEQRLEEFDFNGRSGDGDHANFGFVIAEAAGEVDVTYSGKGAIHCTSGKIMVWSEGAPSP